MTSKVESKVTPRSPEETLYPAPLQDLEEWARVGLIDASDPKLMSRAYWPQGQAKEDMRILVLGCGPNQAAGVAIHNPKATVVGIDSLQAAIDHENKLKTKHKLDNLTLQHMDPNKVDTLKQEFDLIIATSVLHDVEDPVKTLKALGNLLHDEGTISVTVYGKYAHLGISVLQAFFQQMGLKDTPEDLDVVRASIMGLRPDHPALAYIQSTPDLGTPAGLVECLLKPKSSLYNVEECLAMVKDSGLSFMGWHENFLYHPEGLVPGNSPLMNRLQGLPKEQVWQLMELYLGRLFRHNFFICKSKRPKSSYEMDFSGTDWHNFIPHRRIDAITQPNPEKNEPATIRRNMYPAIPLDNTQAMLFNPINGEHTIQQCIEQAGLQGDPDIIDGYARNFFQSMWRIGFLFIELPKP